MTISRIRNLSILAGLVSIVVAVSAWAGRSGSITTGQPGLEVVFGSYHCSMGQGGGIEWASLQSTGDLVPNEFFIQRGIHSEGEPLEVCVASAADAHQIVLASGCSVGPNETRMDETGVSIDFAFVCHDQRSRLTQILADFGSSVLVAAP